MVKRDRIFIKAAIYAEYKFFQGVDTLSEIVGVHRNTLRTTRLKESLSLELKILKLYEKSTPNSMIYLLAILSTIFII